MKESKTTEKKGNPEKKKPDYGMTIPSWIMESTGIAAAKVTEIHRLKHCVAILQGRMTAYELIEAIGSLSEFAEFLTVQLSKVCGRCDDCGACGEALEGEQEIKVPKDALDEAGIPLDAKLGAYADQDNGVVCVFATNHEHDLSDVPNDFLKMLVDAGVCVSELEEHLIDGDIVYGE